MKKGTKVRMFSGDQHKYLGIGTYIGSEMNMPKFKIKGKTLKGCECWWIKLSEAKKIEKKNSKLIRKYGNVERLKRFGIV